MQGPPEAPGWGGRAPWHPGRKRGHSKEAKRVGIWGTSARPSLVIFSITMTSERAERIHALFEAQLFPFLTFPPSSELL